MNNRRLLPWVLCLSILMLLCIVPVRAEEAEPEAEDITRNCIFEKNHSETNALYTHDRRYKTYNTYGPQDVLRVQSRNKQRMGTLYFRLAEEGDVARHSRTGGGQPVL